MTEELEAGRVDAHDLGAAAIRLAKEVMAAVPARLDATPSRWTPLAIRFGPAEVPSGRRRLLSIRADLDGRVGALERPATLRWELCDASGDVTDSGPAGDDAVAGIVAAMEQELVRT